jgi:phosphoglycerate dehydrogenase-like enzyme
MSADTDHQVTKNGNPYPSGASAEASGAKGRSSGKFRVALTGDYEGLATTVAPWSELGEDAEVVAFAEPFASAQETIAALRDFDAVTLMRERIPLTREILEQLPRLKFIVFSGNGNETLDANAAADLDIVVCNSNPNLDLTGGAPGGKSPAELTIALLLDCTWRTGAATNLIREGGWAFRPGVPLRGKTIGIIGYGDIGKPVARTALALGMRVMAFGRSLTDEAAAADNVTRADLDQLLEESDVISIHLRLSPATRAMIGAPQIAKMKDGVIFINTARAQIVEEQPFLEALRAGKIAMAGLDVFWEEPLPHDHPLVEMPNVVMTPHIGYATEEAFTIRYRQMLETLVEYRRGNIIGRYSEPAAPSR